MTQQFNAYEFILRIELYRITKKNTHMKSYLLQIKK